jgi:spermidine synthase
VKGERFLLAVVFISGMTTLAVEMAASRLLAPYFGTSQVIWANLIGLMMIYLAGGYYLGGWLADRYPRREILYQITAWAGFAIGLVPFLAKPILQFSLRGYLDYSIGIFLGSLLAMLSLFLIPVVLLGCVSPFAIRLQAASLVSTGQTAGGIYALSTLGSILGTFLPALVLIPFLGTRATFIIFSLTLLAFSLGGLFLTTGRKALWYLPLLLAILALSLWPQGPIKATEGAIYEEESLYNYIQVLKEGDDILLTLNEGQAFHSFYNPHRTLSYGIWDYFLLAPFFNPDYSPGEVKSLLLIGLGAGTITKEYTKIFGPIPMDGVEIDPRVIEVGRRFFAMEEPNLQAFAQDGRYFLSHTDKRYDVIAVDAYRQPYIPFHLTTREFFASAKEHLTPRGVVAINVGRTASDFRLVEVLASTMADLFPDVYIIDAPVESNSLVVATNQDTDLEDFYENVDGLSHPLLREVAALAQGRVRRYEGKGLVLTDDRAPVEHLVNLMVWKFMTEGE